VEVVTEKQFSSCGLMDCSWQFAETSFADTLAFRLQQTQLAGARDRFGAPLNLELAKDFSIVSFHRIQGEE